MNEQLQMSFVPEALSIKAMRSNGFKSTDTAIAELIDNSIQAGLKLSSHVHVDVVCVEEVNHTGKGSRITDIYVLDNAGGMDPTLMRRALQFGQGTNLATEHQKGMGKFGMGLPNSSISQCRRLDVYSWQSTGQIHKVYLDIDNLEDGSLNGVPLAEPAQLPNIFHDRKVKPEFEFASSGTLVSWTKLDRATWRTHNGVFNNAEYLIGRMYRNFINDGRAKIRFVAFKRLASGSYEKLKEKFVRPNDPLFLMENTSAPAPYNRQPAFVLQSEQEVQIRVNGETHYVTIRASHRGDGVLNEAKENPNNPNPGDLPIGKFTKNCAGVSIVRAGRELCLSQEWTVPYDPVERWWGVEVCFEPALDEILGVSNDKQQAANIRLFGVDEYAAEHSLTEKEALDAIEEEYESGDPSIKAQMKISAAINQALQPIRKILKRQRVGVKTDKRVATPTEGKATEYLDGYGDPSQTEEYQSTPRAQREADNAQQLIDNGATPEDAAEEAALIEENQSRAKLQLVDFDNLELFDFTLRNGFYFIRVNSGHPAIKALIGKEDGQGNSLEESEIVSNLKLLFLTYVDMEAKASDGDRLTQRNVRLQWGTEAYRMFKPK